MRLNVQTDFALRLLACLAANEGAHLTVSAVAERFNISQNHLTKVAHLLGRLGMIETLRGRNGGLRLASPAAEICLGDVVRGMENDFALAECLAGQSGQCHIEPACRLKGILRDAMNAFMAVLDQYTLKDLVAGNSELKLLLVQEVA